MNIQELINKQLEQEQSSRATRERSGKYNPGSLGRCFRLQYFNRVNEPVTNPPEERNLRVMKCGSIFHDIIQTLVLKENPLIQKEVVVETEDFKGYADLVDDGVSDIKTIHSKGFGYLSPETIAKEKYTNWMQVLFYAWKLGKKYAKLVFVSKDDLRIEEYRQELDNYWLNELDMEESKLKYYWDFKTLPPAQPRAFNGKDCSYCNWLNHCKELEGEKHPTLKKKGEKENED
jgi:hypothetical protein